MGKVSDLSPTKKVGIMALIRNTNLSQRQIAEKMSVSQASVCVIKRKIDSGEDTSCQRIGKCGPKRKTSPRDDRKIRKMCTQNRKMSAVKLTDRLKQEGLNVSERTVRRRLYEMGYKCHRPALKPLLTDAMKKKRFLWAKQHKHFTVEDWKRVCNFLILTSNELFNT